MNPDSTNKDNPDEENSLEGSSTVIETSDSSQNSATQKTGAIDASSSPTSSSGSGKQGGFKGFLRRMNIYLLFFVILIVIALGVVIIAVARNHTTSSSSSNLKPTQLSEKQLEKLAATGTTIGGSGQVLNISSDAIFNGQVLMRQNLDIAGSLKVGGNLDLPGLSVSGTSNFAQIQTGKLAVSGPTAIQGTLTIGQNLNVGGTTTFAGSVSANLLTVQNLQLSGPLALTSHIEAGGPTPSRTQGPALGNGGTAALNGSDTAGTVNINTGGSPSAGCFITLTFSTSFNTIPHVVITPVGSAAASMSYYVTRSATNMSICSATTPPANQSFAFDYIVLD